MKILEAEHKTVAIDSIRPHERNVRQGDVGLIYQSINANDFYSDIIIQKSTSKIIVGNHRWAAALQAGLKEVPVKIIDVDDQKALKILLADNKTSDAATNDEAALAELLKELAEDGGLEGSGFDGDDLDQLLSDLEQDSEGASEDSPSLATPGSLAERFGVPPFSVLDARAGYWQERKRAWLALGIQSELGRGEGVTPGDSLEVTEPGLNYYRNRKKIDIASNPKGATDGGAD